MEFGLFQEFPTFPDRSHADAFDEALEQVDAAERWRPRRGVAGRAAFRAGALGAGGAA